MDETLTTCLQVLVANNNVIDTTTAVEDAISVKNAAIGELQEARNKLERAKKNEEDTTTLEEAVDAATCQAIETIKLVYRAKVIRSDALYKLDEVADDT